MTVRPGFQMEDPGPYEDGAPPLEDPELEDEEGVWQRPRRPVIIGANWKRRSRRTYDYIHKLRESYYTPMTDFLDRRAGGWHAIARPPAPRSFDERVCSSRHGPRARASPPPRPPPPPQYHRSTFSDDLLEALGVPLPDPARIDLSEDPVVRGPLRPHKFSNYVPTTSDKILEAMGVRPRGFSELPDLLEPTLDGELAKADPARRVVDEE